MTQCIEDIPGTIFRKHSRRILNYSEKKDYPKKWMSKKKFLVRNQHDVLYGNS